MNRDTFATQCSELRSYRRNELVLQADEWTDRIYCVTSGLVAGRAAGRHITQAVIASYSGISREVVNKTMRDMENRGLVWRDEHGIHVHPNFASTDFGLLSVEGT